LRLLDFGLEAEHEKIQVGNLVQKERETCARN